MELRYSHIEIKPPARITKKKDAPGVICWVVKIKEQAPPEGATPVSWTLLTTVKVNNIEDALERIEWYRKRWSNEEYHRIVKSGCQVEACRLEDVERLKNYIGLMLVVAWRLFWMVHISRTDPKASAEVVLTETELNTLKSLPRFKDSLGKKKTVTVRDAIYGIARP